MATPHQLITEAAPPEDGPGKGLSQVSDADLALAMISGAPDAPKEAWRRFAPLVRRIVARSLGAEREVDDAVQDVFLSVFGKIPTLRNPASLRAFIVSVAIRTLRSEIRRRKVRSWLRFHDEIETPDLRTVQADTDSREALVRFYEILERINLRDRTAFVLHFIEGLELPEVAQAMEVSIPTVRRCIARSREKLALVAGRDPLLVDYVTRQRGGGEP